MKYYSAKTVTKILGVTAQTLRNWDKENKLKPTYVKSNGYRYYSEESILSYTQERKTKKELQVIGYVRVSSKKQKDDFVSYDSCFVTDDKMKPERIVISRNDNDLI